MAGPVMTPTIRPGTMMFHQTRGSTTIIILVLACLGGGRCLFMRHNRQRCRGWETEVYYRGNTEDRLSLAKDWEEFGWTVFL